MVEWFKAAVLKTAEGRPSVGSNPTSSASFVLKQTKKSRSKAKSNIASKTCSLLFLLLSRILLCCPQRSVIFLWGCRRLTPPARCGLTPLHRIPLLPPFFLQKNCEGRRPSTPLRATPRQANLHFTVPSGKIAVSDLAPAFGDRIGRSYWPLGGTLKKVSIIAR